MRANTPADIARVVSGQLESQLKNPNIRNAFFVWACPDRAIVGINPEAIKNIDAVYSERFAHHLSTTLGGVRIERTNSRGIYYQVGYIPLPPARLGSKYLLDLTQKPRPLTVPIGMAKNKAGAVKPLWIPIREADGVLIGGGSGFGKTILLHTWVRSLAGEACEIWLYDGKGGNHFSRYDGNPGIRYIPDDGLQAALESLEGELARRKQILAQYKVHDLDAYNGLGWADKLRPVVLIVDEASGIPPEAAEVLSRLARTGREQGLSVVCAMQRSSVEDVDPRVKANLHTRICFPVPQRNDSEVVLGGAGAEKLDNVHGRLLLKWSARLIEAQGFYVDLSDPLPAVAGGVEPKPPSLPVGSDWLLAQRAMQEAQPGREGVLSIPVLEGWGMSPYRADQLLKRWQAEGWLVSDGGQGATRRLSPRVFAAVSESLKVTRKSESSESAAEG